MTTGDPVVTFLSDFGLRDGYVGAMKGVVSALAPSARLIDAAHDIPAQDVQAAAWALRQYWSLYAPGAIHVCVVDPAVGTDRRALCVDVAGRWIIAPDNGLAGLAVEQAGSARFFAVRPGVHRPGLVSPTFHGRDVFAYVAGCMVSGLVPFEQLCEPLAGIVMPTWAKARSSMRAIEGEVIHVDHFGNLVTNISQSCLPEPEWAIANVRVGSHISVRVRRVYADVPVGTPVALFGSTDNLEIAVNGRSAHALLGCGRGTPVVVDKGILRADGLLA